jgi:tetratricopeptide (TPR) repeat protein
MRPQTPGAAALQALCAEGLALHHQGRLEEARERYKKVLARDPKHFDALHLLGSVCAQSGQTELGVSLLKRAIRVNPNAALAHCALGVALNELKRCEEALASLDASIALAPGHAVAHYNRGLVLSELKRPEDALAAYDRAVALNPADALTHNNRGLALGDLRRPDDALKSLDEALALNPQNPDAVVNRAYVLLGMGRLQEGFAAYEQRKVKDPVAHRFDRGRPWTGAEDVQGRRVFLYHEQGLGDSIQFARYAPLLEARGAEVVLSVQDPLLPLIRQLSPTVELLGEDARPGRFDYHCALLSLPLAFGTTLETIPARERYFEAEPERLAKFEALLGPRTRPRIGLAWSGNPSHRNDHNRSIALARLAPLLAHEADWVALQNEVRPADAAALKASGVRFFGEALVDFADAAALAQLMDLVITVDTSLAHLAGALGKSVFILLPFNPDWRWMLDRSDSPWYPTARLFRQPRRGDWKSVLAEVRATLASQAR